MLTQQVLLIGPDLKEFFNGKEVIGEKIRIKDHTMKLLEC